MKRSSAKKTHERRKRSRASAGSSSRPLRKAGTGRKAAGTTRSARETASPGPASPLDARTEPRETCAHCARTLESDDRALFVEEEIGRIFCSEDCIATYFGPEIERLEKEYFRKISASDLSAPEREALAHLRWITLQEPDEVWREKTLSGDHRYTLISEFQPGAKKIWSVCICLFLRGEPSFLFLAFPTRNAAMAATYRRGERIEWKRQQRPRTDADASASEPSSGKVPGARVLYQDEDSPEKIEAYEQSSAERSSDRLAEAWTEGETYLAQVNQERREDDVPPDEFALYEACMEETLQEPDEVWSLQMGGEESAKLYHFIRHYPEETPGVWYVIVARETDKDEEIEILDAFPTRDASLVDRYRRGEREVGGDEVEVRPVSRVVH